MSKRSTLAQCATVLLSVMLALGPNISPAQALPSGDQAQRCKSTLQQAQGIKTVVSAFRMYRPLVNPDTNRWLQGNGPRLRRDLAAPANRALMTRVLNLSNDIAANPTRVAIAEVEQTIQQLVENLRERREFTVEQREASGVVTKQIAC